VADGFRSLASECVDRTLAGRLGSAAKELEAVAEGLIVACGEFDVAWADEFASADLDRQTIAFPQH
jgi:hypothetical protein